ncbi:flagellar basal-body MS-ring/collar protein FliF [Oleiagrimonas sp. C23AA]|uniref:flagellar basal-body MS-ring/collar protein FliF n=1 Tax=Oleiagrimonas sp. C23AA TaxID=2719047 RepID=UPI001423E39F|nr:flagellar basal-body MS-ring/collar protein FliF [Oleiagrimonas sp. C23AA]NII09194.1 flagellar basal body M-ring protein FliF [Oleiagrimonas sp. C23AA]
MADNPVAQTAGGGTPTASGMRLDSLKSVAQTPLARQLLLLVGMAATVAIGVAVALWSRTPNYGLLYSNLDQKDAAAITQALQTSDVPYKLSADGNAIMVPSDKIPNLRLKLAAQGLPQGSAQSSAVDSKNDSPFGMSDLAERTRYRQALEADLGRTISSLQSIRDARVHLALPKPSAFIRDNAPASASVVVTLFPGRNLGSSQVAAITHLIAASVPGLDPRQVSVIDQQGQLLTVTDPNSATAVNDSHMQITSRIEDDYAQRIQQLLTPLVGPGRVRAQVYADVDFSSTEKASETYGPQQGLLRSEKVSSSQTTDPKAKANVPGALQNQPPNTASQPTAANPQGGPGNTPAGATANAANSQGTGGNAQPTQSSNSATRNFELDRTIAHTTNPAGRIARLTVAVVVDNKQVVGKNGKITSVPFTQSEITRMTELAKNAVGFDAKRGDSVSVINEAFHQSTESDKEPSLPFWQRPGMMDLIKQGVGVLLLLALVFGLLRPMMKGLLKPAQEVPDENEATALPGSNTPETVRAQIREKADNDEDIPALSPTAAYEQRVGLAKRLATENPKQVAQVVKNWVASDEV